MTTTMRSRLFQKIWLGALLVTLAAPVARSQNDTGQDKAIPPSKVERLNRAPVSKEILSVKLPKPVEATLRNGIRILILEDHRFPIITMQIEVDGAGPLYEPSSQPGLAGVTARLLTEGTKTRTSKQIAEQIDAMGASLSSSAGFGAGAAVISASGLSDTFDQWFPLVTDVLLHPSFPSEELEQYRNRAKPALLQQRTQPNFLANQAMNRALYGTFPAAVVTSTPESLDALTPMALADWHDRRYSPQNTLIAIAGDVHSTQIIAKLRKSLGGWKHPKVPVALPAAPPPAADAKVFLVDRPGSVQTTLLMGNLAIARTDPDYPALVVLNEVLGAGAASRLFLNLREEKGYTYGVYSNLIARKYPGPWTAGGDLRTEVTDGAMTEFLRELNRIREEQVPETEMDAARRAIVARFALSLESPQQLIGYAVLRKAYNFPADYWDKYPAAISSVTSADVQRVAQKYINPATMQLVAVGDASKIKSILEKYGPVEEINTSEKSADESGKPARITLH
jgi:zinc protease